MGFHQHERWLDKYQRRGWTKRRQLNINDNREDYLDGDGCFGAQLRRAWIKESLWLT